MAVLRSFLPVLAVLTLVSCGTDSGERSCSPAPQISSSPPVSATVGLAYEYTVDARYICGGFLMICKDIDAVQLPLDAAIDVYHIITWTPTPDLANQDVQFEIATRPDDCGDRATQSWTVSVSAAQ